MRRIISNNITKRLFGTIDTKRNIPCNFCKNYNNENQTCKVFYDYNAITEKKIYHTAKSVRDDDDKCGLEKMNFYEPILNDILKEYKKFKIEKSSHTFAKIFTGSIGGFMFFITIMHFNIFSLGLSLWSFHIFSSYVVKNDKMKQKEKDFKNKINYYQGTQNDHDNKTL